MHGDDCCNDAGIPSRLKLAEGFRAAPIGAKGQVGLRRAHSAQHGQTLVLGEPRGTIGEPFFYIYKGSPWPKCMKA